MRRLRGINIGLTLALVLVALLALVPLGERTSVSAESILASSTFDAGNDGWKKYSLGDTGPYDQIVANFGEANYETAGGNPGGHIATDDLDSQTMWFDAPAKFLGNKSGAYGGTLSLDLKLQFAENWSTADVALIGGGTVVVMDVPNPGTSWTHYNLSLTETAGWKKTGLTGGTPTQAEFKTVLTALTALRIRGEFLWGSEYNRLDNVILTGTASAVAPTATPVPAVGGVAASSYFDAGNEGWKKVSLLDNGPYASLNADFGAANFEAAGGNPGGHIATDDLDFQTMWFDAPSKFLGDKSGSYGLTLSYDLKSQFTPDWHTADVALVGGGMVLVVDTADPGTSWTHYNLSLTETAGWKKDGLNGAAPTANEFKAVLSNLKALRIRGEFSWGSSEYNRLDNVILGGTANAAPPTATPTPVSVAPPPPPPPGGGGTQVTYKAGYSIVAGPAGTIFSQAGRMLYTSQGSGAYDVLFNSQGVTEGFGYWAYFASDTTMTIDGAGSSSHSTSLSAGQMKMVGNPSGTKSAVVRADKIYTYDPNNGYGMYFGSTTLAVGQGAWVFSAGGGTATVTVQ